MIPIELAKGALQLGWPTVTAIALIAVFRLMAMVIAARFKYRLAMGKLVFEPVETSAVLIESEPAILPLVDGPKT